MYGGLPDSYLMPSYRVGAGYSNYPPRPSAVPHRTVPAGRWIADEQRATVGRSQYEVCLLSFENIHSHTLHEFRFPK